MMKVRSHCKWFMLLFCSLFIACQTAPDFERRLLDMTYPFDENSIYWPNANPFVLTKGD